MLRIALFGAALLVATTAGPRPASAQSDEVGAAAGETEEAGEAAAPASGAADSEEAPAPTRKRHRGGKRGRKHTAASGRVVPDDQLRQDPLPTPSGDLHVISANLKDAADVNIYNEDGSYNLDSLKAVDHVLRCRRTDAEKPIDPRLLTLLSHVYDHFGGKPLEIVSGYRNQRKQTSNHYKGTASDIRIKGVSPKKIRAFAETLDTGGMGIGIYPRSGFVHIDVRPAPSYRWVDFSPPNPDAPEKRPPRGWKRKKLQS
jgi:uncharacterized protein YcbK (DUF882 family)